LGKAQIIMTNDLAFAFSYFGNWLDFASEYLASAFIMRLLEELSDLLFESPILTHSSKVSELGILFCEIDVK